MGVEARLAGCLRRLQSSAGAAIVTALLLLQGGATTVWGQTGPYERGERAGSQTRPLTGAQAGGCAGCCQARGCRQAQGCHQAKGCRQAQGCRQARGCYQAKGCCQAKGCRQGTPGANPPANGRGNRGGPSWDGREDLYVGLFTGIAIESFAANEVKKYLNPEAAGDVQEQLVAGFDFQLRLAGNRGDGRQLWLIGETVHGVRSGEVDCKGDNAKSKICKQQKSIGSNQEAQLAIFRQATSFEASFGLRFELARCERARTPRWRST